MVSLEPLSACYRVFQRDPWFISLCPKLFREMFEVIAFRNFQVRNKAGCRPTPAKVRVLRFEGSGLRFSVSGCWGFRC